MISPFDITKFILCSILTYFKVRFDSCQPNIETSTLTYVVYKQIIIKELFVVLFNKKMKLQKIE